MSQMESAGAKERASDGGCTSLVVEATAVNSVIGHGKRVDLRTRRKREDALHRLEVPHLSDHERKEKGIKREPGKHTE